jgi:protein-S-isoprenylcysteine O-methyltransferase Ste14
MRRIAVFAYGAIAYLIFLATFLYAVGFVGNLVVPKSIDSGTEGPLSQSLLINVLLLGLFAIQHSGMARLSFKEHWTKLVPQSIERSTFVLLTCLALALLFWQWRPMLGVIWNVESPVGHLILQVLFWIGFAIVLVSTFMIHHFDLFGLRQVYLYAAGEEYRHLGFRIPGLYKYLRHPIMLGFIIAFWATPLMTVGHLVFAIATTGYILIAIPLEERDLVKLHGERYEVYRQQVSMLMPMSRYEGLEEERASGASAGGV